MSELGRQNRKKDRKLPYLFNYLQRIENIHTGERFIVIGTPQGSAIFNLENEPVPCFVLRASSCKALSVPEALVTLDNFRAISSAWE